jgi:flagellar hook-associated protein 1 FlgK
MGVNATLNSARLGLSVNQFAIDVTSSNVTNLNTPGYVRQRPEFEASGTVDVGAKSFQVGVDIQQVQRIYDRYLESQIVDSKTEMGYGTTAQDYLQRIEGLFNESNGGGINDLLGKFWTSWQNLNGNPQGSAERTVVLAAAQDLASRFRKFSDDLTSVAMDARDEIGATITDINSDIKKIAELNGEIRAQGTNKGDANLLLNERAKLLTSVAEKIGINYIEDAGGNIDIYLTSGSSLVQAGSSQQLEMVGDDIRIKGMTELVTAGITKGKLGAMLAVRDRLVPGYLDSLNTLAAGIVDAVNDQHAKGYTANGEVAGDFFAPVTVANTAARNMALNGDIVADVGKIAASMTVDGDGDNAREIGSISDRLINWGTSTATANGYYGALTAQVGQDVSTASNEKDHRDIIMNQLDAKWQSTSGVSIDEEMMNLIKYQMGYNAAGRLVTVANELMDTLINLGK